jgi:hypothetical protein
MANDLAWAYVMQDDPAPIEEADRFSALAALAYRFQFDRPRSGGTMRS